jgi:diguanylate cyclase (GGDEF)-like protein/PAS domain S-box-containing protein
VSRIYDQCVEHIEQDADFLRRLVAHSPDAYILVGRRGTIEWVSGQIVDLLGYRPDELVGQPVEKLVPHASRGSHREFRARFDTPDEPGSMREGRYLPALGADGVEVPVDIRLSRFSADVTLAVMRDASAWAEQETRLRALAASDPLTGLANRRAILEHVQSALARARRRSEWIALVYLDLDGFKLVNDRYGHEAGDAVLLASSHALASTAREGDLVGRIGGDEFVVCLESLGRDRDRAVEEAISIAERMVDEVARPVRYAGRALEIAISGGVAVSKGAGDSDDLLRDADTALYEAKNHADQAIVVSGS